MTRIRHNPDAGLLRARAYPETGEQIDAIWKILNALIDGKPAPTDALKVRDAVQAVKDKFPKGAK